MLGKLQVLKSRLGKKSVVFAYLGAYNPVITHQEDHYLLF